ncbi:MAG: TrkH family potassium uptake protein, partial [Christensenellaceae bacterium]
FTATSAVCVTGLVVHDTATYWSYFGQAVILLLIQIGGLGVVTVAASFAILTGKKIGLGQRNTMQEALSAPEAGSIVRLTGFILKGVLLFETIGALAMMPVFCSDFGAKGIWMAIFHSVSAFCNAGFDVMGEYTGECSSLTGYASNPVIGITVMLLIVIGGIGFLTWEDVCRHKWRVGRYRTQSKTILAVTGILILLPAVYFFFFEFQEHPVGERILLSLFQSITTRTAGFNTANLGRISEVGLFLMIPLMLIGGSPGSTAGGMKTTTVAILFSSAVSVCRRKENAQLFHRRIADDTVKHAATILMLYLVIFLISGGVICMAEGLPLLSCLYETASAIGTVGLSLGITASLGTASRLILIALMFFGRIGGLTLIYAAFGNIQRNISKLPLDKIIVG